MLEPEDVGASSATDFTDAGHIHADTSDIHPQSPVRSQSYCCAVDLDREKPVRMPSEEVRAGLQANLRLFIMHAAEVFLAYQNPASLGKQVCP